MGAGYYVKRETEQYGKVQVAVCDECFNGHSTDDVVGAVEDDRHWQEEGVAQPECWECDSIIE